jgi:hypothetical protein
VVRSGGDVETIEAYGPKRSLEDGKLGADEREIEDSLHRVSRKSSLGPGQPLSKKLASLYTYD